MIERTRLVATKVFPSAGKLLVISTRRSVLSARNLVQSRTQGPKSLCRRLFRIPANETRNADQISTLGGRNAEPVRYTEGSRRRSSCPVELVRGRTVRLLRYPLGREIRPFSFVHDPGRGGCSPLPAFVPLFPAPPFLGPRVSGSSFPLNFTEPFDRLVRSSGLHRASSQQPSLSCLVGSLREERS